jgi:Holliday junction resolvase RusA-like endonuclease
MAKRSLGLHVRIPPYAPPRNAWRRTLHRLILAGQKRQRVLYQPNDRLELDIKLYISGNDLKAHDVDNRLKDVMDALQGRAGGPKRERVLAAVIPNDRQVYRVSMVKSAPPPQSRGQGHLIVRKLRN